MSTFIFKNEGCPDVEITVKANNESEAVIKLLERLSINSDWLSIDSIYEWEVYTRY